jgi:hypothetical protein
LLTSLPDGAVALERLRHRLVQSCGYYNVISGSLKEPCIAALIECDRRADAVLAAAMLDGQDFGAGTQNKVGNLKATLLRV